MYASSLAIRPSTLQGVIGRVCALGVVVVPVIAGAVVLAKPEILMC
jgi:hypothetical protein